jgi:hypothetical protein
MTATVTATTPTPTSTALMGDKRWSVWLPLLAKPESEPGLDSTRAHVNQTRRTAHTGGRPGASTRQ